MLILNSLLHPKTLWGFDSFLGLPETNEKNIQDWKTHAYRGDPRAELGKRFQNFKFVSGYFNESLHDDISVNMHPATYIDMDVDLFESTFDALDFVFRNGIAVKGTYIGYDDMWVLPCSNPVHPLSVGEGKAHKLIADKYDITFKCANRACALHPNGWGAIFEVHRIGNGTSYGWDALPGERVPACRYRNHAKDKLT